MSAQGGRSGVAGAGTGVSSRVASPAAGPRPGIPPGGMPSSELAASGCAAASWSRMHRPPVAVAAGGAVAGVPR